MIKRYFTYIHKNKDGLVFYVGCATTNPLKRGTRAKLQRAYSSFGHSSAWDEIASAGYEVEIVSFFDDRGEAFNHERQMIAAYRSSGAPLVNICSGGPGMPGAKDSKEVRMKKSVTKIGRLNPMFGKTGAEHPNSRRVIDKESGSTYDSVQIAADALGFKMKTLYNWLSGHRKNPTTLEFA